MVVGRSELSDPVASVEPGVSSVNSETETSSGVPVVDVKSERDSLDGRLVSVDFSLEGTLDISEYRGVSVVRGSSETSSVVGSSGDMVLESPEYKSVDKPGAGGV